MHQQIDAISLGEARNRLRFVLRHSSREIVVTPMCKVSFRLLARMQTKKEVSMGRFDAGRLGWQSMPRTKRIANRHGSRLCVAALRAVSGTRKIDPVGLPVHLHKAGKAAYLG
jgi:hypothetical protein